MKSRVVELLQQVGSSWLTTGRTRASEEVSLLTETRSASSGETRAPDHGEVYVAHLRDVLDGEHRRLASILSRAESLTRTNLTTLTILIAATALLVRSGSLDGVHAITWGLLVTALALDIASVVASVGMQIKATIQSATSAETVTDMASAAWFEHDAATARFTVANRLRESITSLRGVTKDKSSRLDRALWLSLAFVVALVGAVAAELALRI